VIVGAAVDDGDVHAGCIPLTAFPDNDNPTLCQRQVQPVDCGSLLPLWGWAALLPGRTLRW
jgi:hypothetical protein